MNKLFPSLYEEIDMERYAQLTVDVLSDPSAKVALCDESGQVVWASDKKINLAKMVVNCHKQCSSVSSEGCHCSGVANNGEFIFQFNLGELAGNSAGELVFYGFSAGDEATINRTLLNVAETVRAELGYLYEVNAMAGELGDRYNELSMLRASDYAISEYRDSRHILSTYIRCCAEHLNVDHAAVWISSRQEIYPGGVAYQREDKDILTLMENLSMNAFELFKDGHDGFGINDKDEKLRDEIQLPTDKKVLLVPVLDNEGRPCGVLSCLNDYAGRDFNNSDKSTLEAVSRKTYKYLLGAQDDLTGLLNRKGFEESVWRDILGSEAERHLVLIDIDQFKVINSAYGTVTGDAVLTALANVLTKKSYSLKHVARLDADLFAVVLNLAADAVEDKVNEICDDIDSLHIDVDGKQISISSRSGVIALNSNESALADHMSAAELALSCAKEDDMKVVIYRPGNTALVKRKNQLTQVENIKSALEENRFELFCQRIQPLSGDELHYEILVRMLDEEGNLVPPDEFIPVAERFNIMNVVDRWIIENTFKLLTRDDYSAVAKECKWGVNLSGGTIGDDDFHDFVSDCLNRYGFPPTNLYFEITETAAIKNFHNCTAFMNNIHSMGVQFALDDFGSGLSSFSYLKKLSIDYLKIDGSLVKDIVSSQLDQTMVSAIADIAGVLNVQTIAEYVENEAILTVLKDMNIDYAQGYGIMKPRPVEDELQDLMSRYSRDASRIASSS